MNEITPHAPRIRHEELKPLLLNCPSCGRRMWSAYNNQRILTSIYYEKRRLTLRKYRCVNQQCNRFHEPYGPELEGRLFLPRCQFGLDVILAVGETAGRVSKSQLEKLMAQIRGEDLWSFKKVADILKKRTVTISHRSIWNLRHRYKNLLKTSPTSDPQQLLAIQKIGSSILDIFEVPSVGDWAPLWILRDWCSGGVLAAISTPAGEPPRLFEAIGEVRRQLRVPITGFVSDGHPSISKTILELLPNRSNTSSHYIEILPSRVIDRRKASDFLVGQITSVRRAARDLCDPSHWRAG